MTDRERVVVSAYTGCLMCDFSELHKAVEEKLGHPVWTHQFPALMEKIKEAFRDEFLALCNSPQHFRNK